MPEDKTVNDHDTSVDAAQAASAERLADAVAPPEDEVLRRLGGGGDTLVEEDSSSEASDQETDGSPLSQPAQQPDTTESVEEPEPDSSGEEQPDTEPSEPEKDTQEQPEHEVPDNVYIGLGDEDSLDIFNIDEPTPPSETEDKPLTDEERVARWQSTADKATHQVTLLEEKLKAAEATIKDLRSKVAQSGFKAAAFDKTPKDFLPNGEEWIQEEAFDPSTPSGRAYSAYSAAARAHEKEQLKAEIRAEREAERAREAEEQAALQAVEYLRSKRPKDFATDQSIEELVNWSKTIGARGLYILSIARDIANKRLPLSRAALLKAAKLITPDTSGNGTNRRKPIAQVRETKAKPAPVTNQDQKILNEYFVDAHNLI